MPAFRPQQVHLTIQDRIFHFVSYEAEPAVPRHGLPARPSMWYLMVEGRRCPVMPCDVGAQPERVEAALRGWAKANAIGPTTAAERAARQPARPGVPADRQDTWWGPT